MPRPVVAAAVGLVVAGVAILAWSASTAGDSARPVRSSAPHLAAALPKAASAAYGRRVLLVRTPPLEAPTGEIYESARAAGGWELYDATPPGADDFEAALARVASAAAADWDAKKRLEAKTVRALGEAGVAVVFVEDGRRIVSPEAAAEVAGLAPEGTVPGLRVRAAEPVLRHGVDEDGAPRLDVVTRTRDFHDGMWGGSVVVEVDEPGPHVFAWPAEGARVTLNGTVVGAGRYADDLPLLQLDLPAGNVDVEVRYSDSGDRAAVASTGALALIAGIILLLLAFRAHPDRDRPEDDPSTGDDGDAAA
jgi:hypothetical protein